MESRDLGSTGIRIPAIGLGTWQYTGGVGPLRTGISLGACFVDTAESYVTEEIVGQAIHGWRNEIFLATKVSPRHFKSADVIAAANASLKRLNTDYIDLYQLHWPNHTVPIEETMGAMEDLVQSGKVRFIGVSNFTVRDLKKAQQSMRANPIVSNQVRYNLIDRTIEPSLLKFCEQQDITVIAHSPLARGLSSIQAKDPDEILEEVARANSRTAAQVALNWCISKKGVVTIPKANSVKHVEENCAASDFHLSGEHVQLLDRIAHRSRGSAEIALRRMARHALQLLGKEQ